MAVLSLRSASRQNLESFRRRVLFDWYDVSRNCCFSSKWHFSYRFGGLQFIVRKRHIIKRRESQMQGPAHPEKKKLANNVHRLKKIQLCMLLIPPRLLKSAQSDA